MKRTISATLFAVVLVSTAASLEARLELVNGTVQYRLPGETAWIDGSVGDLLPQGATVVTGMRSSARLAVGESFLAVRPLSRVTLDTLSQDASSERALFEMPFGRVDAQVRTARERGVDFRVYTPISTAAVRGTEFSYDGLELEVSEGDVSFENLAGQTHSVRAGQRSRTFRFESIESVEATLRDDRTF